MPSHAEVIARLEELVAARERPGRHPLTIPRHDQLRLPTIRSLEPWARAIAIGQKTWEARWLKWDLAGPGIADNEDLVGIDVGSYLVVENSATDSGGDHLRFIVRIEEIRDFKSFGDA